MAASSQSLVLGPTGLGSANGEGLLSSHIKGMLQRRAFQKGLLVYLSGPVTGYSHTAAGLARPARHKVQGTESSRGGFQVRLCHAHGARTGTP